MMVEFCASFAAPFNYQPVVAYPAAQSLRCFNDPQREMHGWREALTRAENTLMKTFIPAMSAAAAQERALWWPELQDVYLGQISALRGLIPWSLQDRQHNKYYGRLPEIWKASVRALWKRQIILFFEECAAPSAEPHYYAPLDEDMNFSVYLPNGSYRIAVVPDIGMLGVRADCWKLGIAASNGRLKFYDATPAVERFALALNDAKGLLSPCTRLVRSTLKTFKQFFSPAPSSP